jgi:CheY-like chemotaxis protein
MEKKSQKILVVDDEPDILLFLREILEDEGYSVETSADGALIEQLQMHDLPDLILLDMLLSGKDGRELVKYLKAHEETSDIPVIMISAHPTARESALAAGANFFLAKPFDLAHLLDMIEQIVAT